MMRHILQELEWGIAFAMITLILFVIITLLTIEPAIATITETDIEPGIVHCSSQQVLTDDAGHKWEVMFFTEADSPEATFLNLRLSALSSLANIEAQKPLIVSTDNKIYEATDIFLENPPLPTIGQYNFKNIFPRLSTTKLTLEIPLENGDTAHLNIPHAILQEWQQVADRNYHQFPKLPYTFEFRC